MSAPPSPRPVVILPGYLAAASDYAGMAASLRQLSGAAVTIVPLRRGDWLPTVGGRSIWPILSQLEATIQAVRAATGSDRVDLVAHSAGGWIGRIYLGDRPYDVHPVDRDRRQIWNGHKLIDTFITLGTPQDSREQWTRRNLGFVNQTYPGAFYQPTVRYVCVAGRAVAGRLWPGGQRGQLLAYSSYQLTNGDGHAWGDGITPLAAAYLAGAHNLTLDGVWHSPRSPGGRWYGSPEVVAQWSPWRQRP